MKMQNRYRIHFLNIICLSHLCVLLSNIPANAIGLKNIAYRETNGQFNWVFDVDFTIDKPLTLEPNIPEGQKKLWKPLATVNSDNDVFIIDLYSQHLHGPHEIDKDPNPKDLVKLFTYSGLINPPFPPNTEKYPEANGSKKIDHPVNNNQKPHIDLYSFNTLNERFEVNFTGIHFCPPAQKKSIQFFPAQNSDCGDPVISIDDLSDNIKVTSSDPINFPILNLVSEIELGIEPKERVTFNINTKVPFANQGEFESQIQNFLPTKTIWRSPADPQDVGGGGISDISLLTPFFNSVTKTVWNKIVFESADGGTIYGTKIDPTIDINQLNIVYKEDGTYQTFGESLNPGVGNCGCGSASILYQARSISTVPEPSSILGFFALGTLGAGVTLKSKLKPSKLSEKEIKKGS